MDKADGDFELALQLQREEEDKLGHRRDIPKILQPSSTPTSLIDPSWELTDPNPDIRALFLQFNDQFFWGKLSGIEVKWSPRMTLCAGLCVYEGRHGLCSVRLSEPLLKLRPRKDLIETLLHEMIHAYLFVTDNNKDHDGHGPEFCKHMYRINRATGANITVYHNFHDEVEEYRQHWWRCDGPCRSRPPYFGYVKRAMNRAPSARDFWWPEHQKTCGGSYTKVKEPENYGKKPKKEAKKPDVLASAGKGSMDIQSFFTREERNGNKPTEGFSDRTGKPGHNEKKTSSRNDGEKKPQQLPSSTVTTETIDLTSEEPAAGPSSSAADDWLPLPSLPGSSSGVSNGTQGGAVNWRRSDLPNAKTSTNISVAPPTNFPGSGFVLGGSNGPPLADRKRPHSKDSEAAVPSRKVTKEVTGIEKFLSQSGHSSDVSVSSAHMSFPGTGYVLGGGQGSDGGMKASRSKLLLSSSAHESKPSTSSKVPIFSSSWKATAAGPCSENLSSSSGKNCTAKMNPSLTDGASDPSVQPCPVCGVKVSVASINSHLDSCLTWD